MLFGKRFAKKASNSYVLMHKEPQKKLIIAKESLILRIKNEVCCKNFVFPFFFLKILFDLQDDSLNCRRLNRNFFLSIIPKIKSKKGIIAK